MIFTVLLILSIPYRGTPMYASDYKYTPSPGFSPMTPGTVDYSPRTPGSPLETGKILKYIIHVYIVHIHAGLHLGVFTPLC